MKKAELFDKEEEVMRIFLRDFYSLKEASKIYDPELPDNARNHRTVAHYFYPFKEKNWFESGMKRRKKAGGGYSTWERYRLNFNFYFELRGYKFKTVEDKRVKELVTEFLSETVVRKHLIKSKEGLLQSIDRLLFLLYRFSIEYHYNEFIQEWFPDWSKFYSDPEHTMVINRDVPAKYRLHAVIWKYAWALTLENKKSTVLVDKNPLLSEYEETHKFYFTAQQGKFFDKWRKKHYKDKTSSS